MSTDGKAPADTFSVPTGRDSRTWQPRYVHFACAFLFNAVSDQAVHRLVSLDVMLHAGGRTRELTAIVAIVLTMEAATLVDPARTRMACQ
jgi:hypothetical protein